MAKSRGTSFIRKFHEAAGRAAPPHLDPINAVALEGERALALNKAGSLLAYQQYLADARAAKARRTGVSLAFERNLQAQARQAFGDLEAFCGAALRTTQQANQTNLWDRTFARMTSTLRATGPLDPKQVWNELRQNQQYKSALESHGLTEDLAAAVTETISKLDANLVLRNGKLSVESRVAGESQPRRLSLKPQGGPFRSITDLMCRSQFEQVVSAFTHDEPIYFEVVPSESTVDYEPADLFALGAVAARQRMAEHVRKLEDTGLAIYEGNDPVSVLVGMVIVGFILGIVGSLILSGCGGEDSLLCSVGELLVWLSVIALGFAFALLIGVGASGMLIAIAAWGVVMFLPPLVHNYDRLGHGFSVST